MASLLSDEERERLFSLWQFGAEVWKDYPPERLCLPPEFRIAPREVISLDQIWLRARLFLYSESEQGLLAGVERLRTVVESTPVEQLEANMSFAVSMRLLWIALELTGAAKMKANDLLPI